jgi:hypothetical protein
VRRVKHPLQAGGPTSRQSLAIAATAYHRPVPVIQDQSHEKSLVDSSTRQARRTKRLTHCILSGLSAGPCIGSKLPIASDLSFTGFLALWFQHSLVSLRSAYPICLLRCIFYCLSRKAVVRHVGDILFATRLLALLVATQYASAAITFLPCAEPLVLIWTSLA